MQNITIFLVKWVLCHHDMASPEVAAHILSRLSKRRKATRCGSAVGTWTNPQHERKN